MVGLDTALATPMTQLPRMARRMRRPTHTWNLKFVPFVLQPFLLAPVLAGETLKNALFQARVVTDPIKNPLIGWHLEHYLFYVPLRAMPNAANWQNLVIDPSWDATAYDVVAANTKYYHAGGVGALDWVAECLQVVTQEFFRNSDETWNNITIDGLPVVQINGNSALDSAKLESEVDDDDVSLTVGVDDLFTMREMTEKYNEWAVMRMQGLTSQTYEEYLASHGVRVQEQAVNRPELIRYVRDWSYPTNTVEPTTGAPTSALSWSVQDRADKDRYFKEPGFLFGTVVARPKVYLSKQTGHFSAFLNDALKWLPMAMGENAEASISKHTSGTGPLQGITTAYQWDARDLFIHGDQFLNYAIETEAKGGFLPLPVAATLQKRYPTALADVQALFVTGASAYWVKADGVCSLAIASRMAGRDLTPTVTTGLAPR